MRALGFLVFGRGQRALTAVLLLLLTRSVGGAEVWQLVTKESHTPDHFSYELVTVSGNTVRYQASVVSPDPNHPDHWTLEFTWDDPPASVDAGASVPIRIRGRVVTTGSGGTSKRAGIAEQPCRTCIDGGEVIVGPPFNSENDVTLHFNIPPASQGDVTVFVYLAVTALGDNTVARYVYRRTAADPSPTQIQTVAPTATSRPPATPTVPSTGTATGAPTRTPSATPPRTPTRTRTVATPVDLIADKLEVVQSVQDLTNSVRLVAKKKTFVRFYAHAKTGAHKTTASLEVSRGSLRKTLHPSINPGGAINVRAKPRRDVLDHAFLFELPTEFTQVGESKLSAVLNPNNAPPESDRTNNTLTITLAFEEVPALPVVVHRVKYSKDQVTYEATLAESSMLTSWLRRAYPIGSLRVKNGKLLVLNRLPTCQRMNRALEAQRVWDRQHGDPKDSTLAGAHYYAMVPDGGGFMRGCAADIPSLVASGPSGDPTRYAKYRWDNDGNYVDWYGGHELAHSYGRPHAEFCGAIARSSHCVGGTEEGDACKINDNCPAGACQPDPYPAGYEAYPYPDGRISPAVDGDGAFFGFDSGRKRLYEPAWHDVMTYCKEQWISDFTYHRLMNTFQTTLGVGAARAATAVTDRLLIIGSVDLNTGVIEVEPVFMLPNAVEMQPRVPGDWAIVLRDAGGSELARYPFTPSEIHEGPPSSDVPGEAPVDVLLISEQVPYVTGTARIEIAGPGLVKTLPSGGTHAPTVQVITPNYGETITGDVLRIYYTAYDEDGVMSMRANIEYSPDNGATWTLVDQNNTQAAAEIDVATLRSSTQALVRVWVTDGLHTVSDVSDEPFIIPNAPPSVVITEPPADVTIAQGQTLGLGADATDRGTGTMPDDQVEWQSSLDGSLGTGSALSTADLTMGVHTITVRADDGSGGVGSDSVQVTVVADIGQLPPVPDRLVVAPSLLQLDTRQKDTRATVAIENQSLDNVLTWNASTDVEWLHLGSPSGTTPDELDVILADTALTPGVYRGTITIENANDSEQRNTISVELMVADELVCAGDCNGDRVVTVDELVVGVNIALDTAALGTCPSVDCNGTGQVTVDCVVRAVNNALNGCG